MQTLFNTKAKTETPQGEREGGRVLISPYSILILANSIFNISKF